MGIISEFKSFALKGNVFQLAIGVVIGAAFGKIVNSLVSDIIMPPLGVLIGDLDFKEYKLLLKETVINGKANPVYLTYGNFLQTVIEFLLVALSIFILMKVLNAMYEREKLKETIEKPAEESKETLLLTDIRNILERNIPPDDH